MKRFGQVVFKVIPLVLMASLLSLTGGIFVSAVTGSDQFRIGFAFAAVFMLSAVFMIVLVEIIDAWAE